MSTNNPPQNSDPRKGPYNPKLDKEGNPIKTKFGHILSAELTDDEKKTIDKMMAEGSTQRAIWKHLGTTQGRLTQYLEKRATAERIALLAMTTTLIENSYKQTDQIEQLVEIIKGMEQRLSHTQTEVKVIHKATQRQRIGRAQVERKSRTQRQEVNRLRHELHKRTGRRPK